MITDLKQDHLPGIRDVYNEGVTNVPHCYPVTAERFTAAFGPVLDNAKGPERLSNERVLVAVRGSKPCGFVHFADETLKDGARGAIRFLMYRPGDRSTGQALLEAALDGLGEKDVVAFDQHYRYEFYHRSCVYLSDRIGHVQALLQVNGFERRDGEVFMDWSDYDVDPSEPSFPVTVKGNIGDETDYRRSLENVAILDREAVAHCEIGSCGRWTDAEEVQDRLFVHWLGVEDKYQGKGLGRYLLLRTMKDAKELGYRHAAISTAVDNHRAFVFYTNCGFRVTDWTYGGRKEH